MTSSRVPTVEFDYSDPAIAGPRFWDAVGAVRRAGPLAWTESNGGYWVTASYETVLRIAQDWRDFSSAQGVALGRPSFEVFPRMVPIENDPPRHRAYRRQVNPALTVKAVSPLEGEIRAIADELIDAFIGRASCDIAVDFARKFPGTVFFRLIAHCTDEDFRLAEPAARVLSFESDDAEKAAAAAAQLRAWASGVFADRAGQPAQGDLVDAVMQLTETDDGEPWLAVEHLAALQLLAQGGIGTSASLIGSVMLALGRDSALRQRVRDDPRLVPGLIEEVLRMEAPVTLMFRTATRDIEIDGRRVRKGDKVCLIFGAAGRDPSAFERPDEVDLDRSHCRHLAFGAGVHRCIGSNLARLQVRIAIQQLVTRLGDFWVPRDAEVRYSTLQARGPVSIPLQFTGGRKAGSQM
jgi:cytochrome P450